MASHIQQLRQLAHLYGVQTAYYDVFRRRKVASSESLLRTLQTLGVSIVTLQDVATTLRARRQELWQRFCEPIIVVWNGEPAPVEIHLPTRLQGDGAVVCHLTLETGEERRWVYEADRCAVVRTAEVEGVPYVARQLLLPEALPLGYHQLRFEVQGQLWTSVVLSAPRRAFVTKDKLWGMFLPLYALYSQNS